MKLPLLCAVFTNPRVALALSLSQWSLLVRQARSANVLARLGCLLQEAGIDAEIPEQPRSHINSAQIYLERFVSSLSWEMICIQQALKAIDVPLVFLKGSAYAVVGDEAAKGRTFSDVDILVPEQKLEDVEMALINAGWITNTLDSYDQKYYRRWMHEIPPLRHLKRHTSIDVHHNILPKTTRFCPDANKLLAGIVSIPDKNCWVLAPEDRIIHSATHLFHEGEFSQGFRDLSDLDLLLKEFSVQDNFWRNLIQRAAELKQTVPLHYALRYTRLILQTPVPEGVLAAFRPLLSGKIRQKLMDALFFRALMPDHESCNDRWTGLARWLLFIRSHWLKMPLHLLVAHLTRKAFKRAIGTDAH